MGLPVPFRRGLSVRPPTDLVTVLFGLLAQTVALSLVGSSPFRFGAEFESASEAEGMEEQRAQARVRQNAFSL